MSKVAEQVKAAQASAPVQSTASLTVDTGSAASVQNQVAGSDEPLLNKAEVVELRKEARENAKLMKEMLTKLDGMRTPAPVEKALAAPAPDEAMQKIAALERKLALKDAVSAVGFTNEQRLIVEQAAAHIPVEQLPTFVETFVKTFGVKNTSTAIPVTEAAPAAMPAVSNTGAPGGTGQASLLPSDPRLIPIDQWKAFTREERKKMYEGWLRSGGVGKLFS